MKRRKKETTNGKLVSSVESETNQSIGEFKNRNGSGGLSIFRPPSIPLTIHDSQSLFQVQPRMIFAHQRIKWERYSLIPSNENGLQESHHSESVQGFMASLSFSLP